MAEVQPKRSTSLITIKPLLSFLLTAVVTIVAIIYGYFSESLPKWYLNEVDLAVISMCRNWGTVTKVLSLFGRLWSSSIDLIRALLGKPKRVFRGPIKRQQRIEALTRFILALSDQQLVTGLAIQIGALGSRCSLSTFEFNVVVALTWFSFATHLATLDVLRDYFNQHYVVRNVRFAGMMMVVSLLLYESIIIGLYDVDAATPLQCLLEWRTPSSSQSQGETLGVLVVSAFLASSSLTRLAQCQVGRQSFLFQEVTRSSWLRGRILGNTAVPQLDADTRKRIAVEIETETRARRHRILLENDRAPATWPPASTWNVGLEAYSISFLSNLPVLLFCLSYGITQVSTTRWFFPPKLAEKANTVSFGQIVPLLLMLIPVLAAAEVYYGEQDSHIEKIT